MHKELEERFNPYYDSDKLGWKTLEFSDDEIDYAFDYLCFWKTKDGLVYSASDSGCSCPSPFEDYEGTEKEIIQKLERVKDFKHAKTLFDEWNNYEYRDSGKKTSISLTEEDWEAFIK